MKTKAKKEIKGLGIFGSNKGTNGDVTVTITLTKTLHSEMRRKYGRATFDEFFEKNFPFLLDEVMGKSKEEIFLYVKDASDKSRQKSGAADNESITYLIKMEPELVRQWADILRKRLEVYGKSSPFLTDEELAGSILSKIANEMLLNIAREGYPTLPDLREKLINKERHTKLVEEFKKIDFSSCEKNSLRPSSNLKRDVASSFYKEIKKICPTSKEAAKEWVTDYYEPRKKALIEKAGETRKEEMKKFVGEAVKKFRDEKGV